jgi:hypothetical protein
MWLQRRCELIFVVLASSRGLSRRRRAQPPASTLASGLVRRCFASPALWRLERRCVASLVCFVLCLGLSHLQEYIAYGWMPHNDSFGFLDRPRGVLGQNHFFSLPMPQI